jgi:HPt (histidine-containing phosphotransfer) domain-containing protein
MEICDLTYLKSVSPNNPKFISEMIEIFLKNVPTAMQSLNSGLTECDWDSIQFHAHKLRSHIDCMGISKTYGEMARQIEEYAREKENYELIKSMVPKLENVFGLAYTELKNELTK